MDGFKANLRERGQPAGLKKGINPSHRRTGVYIFRYAFADRYALHLQARRRPINSTAVLATLSRRVYTSSVVSSVQRGAGTAFRSCPFFCLRPFAIRSLFLPSSFSLSSRRRSLSARAHAACSLLVFKTRFTETFLPQRPFARR